MQGETFESAALGVLARTCVGVIDRIRATDPVGGTVLCDDRHRALPLLLRKTGVQRLAVHARGGEWRVIDVDCVSIAVSHTRQQVRGGAKMLSIAPRSALCVGEVVQPIAVDVRHGGRWDSWQADPDARPVCEPYAGGPRQLP